MSRIVLLGGICMVLFVYCSRRNDAPAHPKQGLQNLSPDSLYILVETGAGEVPDQYWTIQEQKLVDDTTGRRWDFLPAMVNHGKLVTRGTVTNWPVLFITRQLPSGSLWACQPVAVMTLEKDDQEMQYIIALPVDSLLPTIHPVSFMDFMTRYDGVRHLLENWMIHYQGMAEVQRVQWYPEQRVQELIDTADANFKQ